MPTLQDNVDNSDSEDSGSFSLSDLLLTDSYDLVDRPELPYIRISQKRREPRIDEASLLNSYDSTKSSLGFKIIASTEVVRDVYEDLDTREHGTRPYLWSQMEGTDDNRVAEYESIIPSAQELFSGKKQAEVHANDISTTSQTHLSDDLANIFSSPLSSSPSDIGHTWSPPTVHDVLDQAKRAEPPPDPISVAHKTGTSISLDFDSVRSQPQIVTTGSDSNVLEEPILPPAVPNHFLRKRTAAQIQPYHYERHLYELQLKRRGIRPFRISAEENITVDNNSDDSQFVPPQDSVSTSPTATTSRIESSQDSTSIESLIQTTGGRFGNRQYQARHKQKKRATSRQLSSSTRGSSVYDFPSESLGRAQDKSQQQHSHQRIKSKSQLSLESLARNVDDSRAGKRRRRADIVLNDHLPVSDDASEPGTSGLLNNDRDVLKAYRNLDRHIPPLSDDESDADDAGVLRTSTLIDTQTGHQAVLDVPSSETSSTSSSDDDSSDGGSRLELAWLKRRIRGVLPPSFLALDHSHSQTEKAPRGRPKIAATQDDIRRGHAIKRINPARAFEGAGITMTGDSDSDSDNRAIRTHSRSLTPRRAMSSNVTNDYMSEDSSVEVADHVDRMAGRRSRTPKSTPASVHTKITRLKKSRNKEKKQNDRIASRKQNKLSQRHKQQSLKRTVPSRVPKIGIIDAFIASNSPRTRNFPPIRRAVKESARRQRNGRDSPSRKFFEFEEDDDAENGSVAEVLQQWREGTHEAFNSSEILAKERFTKDGGSHSSHSHEVQIGSTQQARRRLPLGVIAVVPPPQGVVQVMGPPPIPRRNQFLEYEEVESGEYTVRARPKKKIDEIRSFQALGVSHSGRHDTSPVRGIDVSPATDIPSSRQRQSRKPREPKRRIKTKPTPTFENLFRDNSECCDNNEYGDYSNHTAAYVGAQEGDSITRLSPVHLPDEPAQEAPVIAEFNFTVLNFSVTFDVVRLLPGTRFKPTTFIGRGGLKWALNTPPAIEDLCAIGLSTFHFEERGAVFLWRGVSKQMLEELQLGYDILLDWVLNEQHDVDTLSEARFDQSYAFCIFLANYIRNSLTHESYDNIMLFAATINKLTVRVVELFTQFHGRTTRYSHLSFYMLAFQLLYIYEIYAMLQSCFDDYSHLAIDREFLSVGTLLVQVLLRSGIDDLYKFLKTHCNQVGLQIGNEFHFVEIWIMTIHAFDSASVLPNSKIHCFWESYYKILDGDSLSKSINISLYEQVWYATFAMCPLYQFDSEGVYDIERSRAYWTGIEKIMETLRKASKDRSGSREYLSYCRACFARCLILTLHWNWVGTKSMAMVMYQYFSQRRLENLEPDIFDLKFPNFVQDPSCALEFSSSDTIFHIFLKYLAKLINDIARISSRPGLSSLIGLVTPLSARLYPRTAELKLADLESLENSYSLLLTLFWAAPPDLRPSVRQLRDVIVMGESHSQARYLSLKAWYYVIRMQLRADCDISETGEWYKDLLRYTLEDFVVLDRVVCGLSIDEHKRRRANVRDCESLLKGTLQFIRNLVCSPNLILSQDQAMQIFRISGVSDILSARLVLPDTVVVETLQIVQHFLSLFSRITDTIHIQSDSVCSEHSSYGDDSGIMELMKEESLVQFAKLLMETVFDSLYFLLSNLIGSTDEADVPSDQLIERTIDTWALLARFLVTAGLKDWNYFTEGRGAWKWLAETETRERFQPYWHHRVAAMQQDIPDI